MQIVVTLPPDAAALFEAFVAACGRPPEEIAASVLAAVLIDDAAAHEAPDVQPEPAAAQPIKPKAQRAPANRQPKASKVKKQDPIVAAAKGKRAEPAARPTKAYVPPAPARAEHTFTPGEDATIRSMRSVGAGPSDIAKSLNVPIADVRRRISELWVRK